MSTHWRLAVVSVTLFISALAAPQNDHVKQQAIPADTVGIPAADPQDGDLSTTDPGGLGHDLTSDLPNSMTSTEALQRSATQESEADSSDAAPDVRSSQSGWYTPPHSNPWFFHQLSPETLRQCASVAGRSQRSDDEERDGGRDKKVLRALGCTQAVLGDGQLRIVAGLEKIQTALWEKVEYLKECIEDVLHKVSDSNDGGQVDELNDIKDGVDTLISGHKMVSEFVTKFRSAVLDETALLKRGQRSILGKLVNAEKDAAMLKDAIALLKRTVESLTDVVGKRLTKLSDGQTEIKEDISSLDKSINDRLDDIKAALDGIPTDSNVADALNALASSIAMIKTDQIMIKSSLDSTKAMILSDIEKLFEAHKDIIEKLRKSKNAILKDTADLKDGQDMIKTDLTSVKDMVLSDIDQLKTRQGTILSRFDDFRNLEPKVDMIKLSQSSLATAVQVNMDKISVVDDKLTELTTKFSSFASKQNRFGRKLSKISEVLETLTAKVMSCCGSTLPTCGENEILSSTNKCLGCPKGFTVHKDARCYFFSSEKKKYEEAKRDCVSRGSVLATMTNGNKELIFEEAADAPSDRVWIGLFKTEENDWMWEDGTNYDTNINLFQNDRFNQDCATAYSSPSGDVWDVTPCSSKKEYVCQVSAE